MVFRGRGGRQRRREDGRHGDRRRAGRQTAGWASRYLVTDQTDQVAFRDASDYAPCVLRDLSVSGAGLQLSGLDATVGDRVVLDLQLGERQRASIQVTGEVRHAAPADDGQLVAGVEFVDVGDLERALLLRLVRSLQSNVRELA
jgi:PilZ domain